MGGTRQPLKSQSVYLIFPPANPGNSNLCRSRLPWQANQQGHVIARLDRGFCADPHPPQGEIVDNTRTMSRLSKPTLLITPNKITGNWGGKTHSRVPPEFVQHRSARCAHRHNRNLSPDCISASSLHKYFFESHRSSSACDALSHY